MAGTRSSPVDVFGGLLLPFRGFGLVARHGTLLALSFTPVLLTAIATFGAAAAVGLWGDALMWAKPDPAAVEGAGATTTAWLSLIGWWIGRVLVTLLGALVGMVVARILSAPLMDLLAERAMKLLGHRAPDGVTAFGSLPLAKSIPLSLARAAGRGAVLLAGVAVLFALSFIPGAAIVTTPLSLVWTAAWLFVDTTVYALQWVGDATLADVRGLVREKPWRSLGFAASTALLTAIPFVGFFLTPAAVAGACLFVGETQPSRANPPPLSVPAAG